MPSSKKRVQAKISVSENYNEKKLFEEVIFLVSLGENNVFLTYKVFKLVQSSFF